MRILTAREYGTIITALKELKKVELKEAATFAAYNTDEFWKLATLSRDNAAEIERIIEKLDKNILDLVSWER